VRDPETGIDYTEPGMNVDVVTGKPISEAALGSGTAKDKDAPLS
jgi:hypothetical protein